MKQSLLKKSKLASVTIELMKKARYNMYKKAEYQNVGGKKARQQASIEIWVTNNAAKKAIKKRSKQVDIMLGTKEARNEEKQACRPVRN